MTFWDNIITLGIQTSLSPCHLLVGGARRQMTFQTNFTASNNNFLFATAQDSPKWQLKRSVIYSNVDANHFTEKPKWFVHWHNDGRFTRLLQQRKNKLILTAGPRHPSLKILSSMASEHLFKKPFYMY